MTNSHNIFISYKRKNRQAANCWSYSNVMLLRPSFGVLLVLLWLSYGALKWIRSTFEEDPKVMRRYMQNISSLQVKAAELGVLAHEPNLVVPESDVLEHIIRFFVMATKGNISQLSRSRLERSLWTNYVTITVL